MSHRFLVDTPAIWMSLALACAQNDPTAAPRESEAGARVYALRAVAGDQLPAVTLDNQHVTIVTIGDTIVLEPGGTGVRIAVQRITTKPAGEPLTQREEHRFSYENAVGRIALSFECNDVIIRMCVAPPHFIGDFTEARLVIQSALSYRTPLEYGRI